MIHLETKTLGVMDCLERQMEYMLVCATFNCAVRDEGAWLGSVVSWFKPEYFTDAYLRSLYMAILANYQEGAPADEAALLVKLPADGGIFGKRLAELYGIRADGAAQAGNIGYYAKQVYNAYRKIGASEDISGAAEDMKRTRDPDSVLEQLPGITSKYAPAPENRARDNSSVMQDIIDEMSGKKRNEHIRFGIGCLDSIVDGLPPAALVTIAAQSTNGKSVMLGQTALHCVEHHGKVVLYFTFEMSVADCAKRWASMLSRQPFKGGNRKQFIGGLSRVERHICRDGLMQVFTGSKTVEEIASVAMAFRSTCDVGLIVVDYIQIVTSTDSRAIREQQVSHIAESLKRLATDTGVPVLTASQLNESGQVRESRAIKNASNILIHLEPDTKKQPIVDIDIVIDKHRDGAQDICYAVWEKPLFTIRDKGVQDLDNFDPSLASVTESDLPDFIEQQIRNQPEWN